MADFLLRPLPPQRGMQEGLGKRRARLGVTGNSRYSNNKTKEEREEGEEERLGNVVCCLGLCGRVVLFCVCVCVRALACVFVCVCWQVEADFRSEEGAVARSPAFAVSSQH